MKHTKFALVIIALLANTGCETDMSGAEISALGESLVSESQPVVDDSVPANNPPIDYSARADKNYNNAVSTCQAENRLLCTKAQLASADLKGKLDYHSGYLRSYWMQTEFIQGVGNANNAIYSSTYDASYRATDTSFLRPFYCCAK